MLNFHYNMSKRKSRSSNKKSKRIKISKNNKRTKHTERSDAWKRSLVEGEERKVHEEIIDRRIRGGSALTNEDIAEAYDRAQKQWQDLPGSIVKPPTDITLPAQKRPKSQDNMSGSEQTGSDEAANRGQRD
jgi:hypothetical protein